MIPGYKITSTKSHASSWVYDSDLILESRVNIVQFRLIEIESRTETGYVELVETPFGHWETHTFLDEELRGKGLGIELFSRAFKQSLEKHRRVMSSTYTSDAAIRLWESKTLNKLYEIEKVDAIQPIRKIPPVRDRDTNEIKHRRKFQYALKSERH